MPIISASLKAKHLAARSAMSSPFRYVAVTIASSIGAAMKRQGGRGTASTQLHPLPPDRHRPSHEPVCSQAAIHFAIIQQITT
jgi:hypothetical protein